MLLWNITLALAWSVLTGDFSLRNFAFGFLLGFLVLFASRHAVGGAPGYAVRARHLLSFILFFLWELVLANLRVAREILTPTYHMRPGIVAIPLDARSDAEITLLASFITLTPGTMSIDVSTDRKVLYIHAMYVEDADAVRRKIKQGFERRLLEVMR